MLSRYFLVGKALELPQGTKKSANARTATTLLQNKKRSQTFSQLESSRSYMIRKNAHRVATCALVAHSVRSIDG